MSAVRIVMVLWGGLFLVLGPLLPPGDGDLWWQRWLGDLILRTHHLPSALGPETFTSAGVPWVPQEWLLSIVVALTMDRGLLAVLKVLFSLIPIAILASIYLRSRDRSTPVAIAIVLLCCGISLDGSFGVRAQVLGWGAFALFLFFLQRRDAWYYGGIAAVAIWANVHASAMLAPIFLSARILGAVLDRGLGDVKTNRDLRILPFVVLAIFCTPLTWHLPAYALALAVSPIRHYIQEWQPAALNEPEFLLGALPLALFVAIGGIRAAFRNKAESLPIVMLFAAALLARRNEPLFAIAAAPLAAQSLDVRFPQLRGLAGRIAGLERFAIAATCVAFALSGVVFALARGNAPSAVPAVAIARLAAGGTTRRLFCENFSDCSLALQYPNIRVFMDGRCDPYPLDVWQSYVSMIRVEPSWKNTLRRYGIDSVVAPRNSPIAKALASDAAWRSIVRGGSFALYERT
jgi:hypothetical protein